MNIITGTIKTVRQVSFGLLLTIIAAACTSANKNQEAEVETKSDVKVTSPVIKDIGQTVSFKGTIHYLQTNTIRSRVNGIVKGVNCRVAGTILARQPLFIIQTLEAAALQKSTFTNENFKSFQDTIFSSVDGAMSSLEVQVGDYVQSGDVLGSYIRANSLRILVDVPVEQAGTVKTGMTCDVLLPNGEKIGGKVVGLWSSAIGQDQTQAFIVEPLSPVKLPENISLSVQFKTGELKGALLIPKNALLGDELQTSFWVMKLVNDSTCIKVPVDKGLETDSLVQLLRSGLTPSDRLVYEGGYGLPDTAIVRIIKK